MVKHHNTYKARDRESWRAWLAENHAALKEVWVLFPKKHTGERCMSYEDSVEEALCFGWIDSIIKRIDDSTYARKFTPRTDSENWSEVNKKRVAKCIAEGRMTEAGLAKVNSVNAQPRSRPPMPKTGPPPADLVRALKANPTAWTNFNALAPSHQRRYIIWIIMAKREQTRARRVQEAIAMLAKNEKLGLK